MGDARTGFERLFAGGLAEELGLAEVSRTRAAHCLSVIGYLLLVFEVIEIAFRKRVFKLVILAAGVE